MPIVQRLRNPGLVLDSRSYSERWAIVVVLGQGHGKKMGLPVLSIAKMAFKLFKCLFA